MPQNILIIDDETNLRHMLKSLLQNKGYIISEAEDGKQGLDSIKRQCFDFILSDIKMPVMDGIEFLTRGKTYLANTTVIMMSAYGSIDLAIKAMRLGAYDYISKPFKTDEVLLTLKKAEERLQLKKENHLLRMEIKNYEKKETFSDIIGESDAIRQLLLKTAKAARYNTPILITGESGTGKELVARGIHNSSPRSAKPFVTVNCASIPQHLLESEFFGFTKGAFTGAETNKAGLFKEADGGTLFLDEIAELPIELQAKFLRVLQDGEMRQLGANQAEKVDVRILAATAKSLGEEVRSGNFREDLYYRLNVVELTLPPLRERHSDIPLLIRHFIDRESFRLGIAVDDIAGDALDSLCGYHWPGNIRELKNVIKHALIFCEGKKLTVESLPQNLQHSPQRNTAGAYTTIFSLKEGRIQLEKELIQKALKKTKGNKSQAAALLEISYPSLLAKIKDYEL